MPRPTKKPQKATPTASKTSRPTRRTKSTTAAETATKSTDTAKANRGNGRTVKTNPAKTPTMKTKANTGRAGNKTPPGSRQRDGDSTRRSETPSEAAIRERAFEIYASRGWSAPERAVQDWLEAESQLLGKRRTR